MSGTLSGSLTDAEVVAMPAGGVRILASRVLPHLSPKVVQEIPDDSLLIDVLQRRWASDPTLVPPGYALGHAHGFNADADEEIKTSFVAQLAQSHRRHVASFHPRELEETVDRANREAKALFVGQVRDAVAERVTTDPELLALVVDGNADLKAVVEAKAADQGTPIGLVAGRDGKALAADPAGRTVPADREALLDLVTGDPSLVVAAKATARNDPVAYARVMDSDPALVVTANTAAREHATGLVRAWEAKRDVEVEAIATMADELETSAPLPETKGGSRGVLLDLQYEVHDDVANRWITHRVYRWVTYDELKSDGRAVVEGMRAELDALAADDAQIGTLRTKVLPGPKGGVLPLAAQGAGTRRP